MRLKFRRSTSLLLVALATALPTLASARVSEPTPITLESVAERVASQNYLVLENALKVYQAKESIRVARANLLPKLNLWRLAELPFDPKSALGMVEDIAPFLVPANWFRVDQQKALYFAQQEAYRALWANEVMTAKALYVHAVLDGALLEHIDQSVAELNAILEIVQSREMVGGVPQGTSREIEIRLLGLREDRRSLEVLNREEKTLLAYALGLDTRMDLILEPVAMPDFAQLEPLRYQDFEFRALDSSPEIRQYDGLLKVIGSIKKEIQFSFLGVSSLSRGVAGGAFDAIPAQQSLGFGTGASLRITKAQKQVLELQRRGVEETLKRTLRLLVDNYNLDLENYSNLKRRTELTAAALEQLDQRLRLGDEVDALDLIDASRGHIQADTSFFAVQYRFLANEDRLARLIFHGDYAKMPQPKAAGTR